MGANTGRTPAASPCASAPLHRRRLIRNSSVFTTFSCSRFACQNLPAGHVFDFGAFCQSRSFKQGLLPDRNTPAANAAADSAFCNSQRPKPHLKLQAFCFLILYHDTEVTYAGSPRQFRYLNEFVQNFFACGVSAGASNPRARNWASRLTLARPGYLRGVAAEALLFTGRNRRCAMAAVVRRHRPERSDCGMQ